MFYARCRGKSLYFLCVQIRQSYFVMLLITLKYNARNTNRNSIDEHTGTFDYKWKSLFEKNLYGGHYVKSRETKYYCIAQIFM